MTYTELFLIGINLFLQCSPIPVVREMYQKKSVNPDHDPIIFIALFVNGIIQITYGLLIWQTTLIMSQLFGASLSLIYLVIFYKYAEIKKQRVVLRYIIIIILCIIIGYHFVSKSDKELAIQVIGSLSLLSNIVMMLAPLSTMKAVIRDQNSIHLPRSIVIAGFISCFTWFLYGIMLQNIFIWSPNIIGIASFLFQIGLLIKYPASDIINYQKVSINDVGIEQ